MPLLLPVQGYVATAALLEGLQFVLWKEVDEGWVRFDPTAGQTLLLAPISRFVLGQLSLPGRVLSVDDLAYAVLHEEPDAPPDDCRLAVSAAVDALAAARLIEQHRPS